MTEGIVSALNQAQAAAGDKEIYVMGSASVVQQCLQAGLLDEIRLHLVPVLLGEGIRWFEHLGGQPVRLEKIRGVETSEVTHLTFRVVKEGDRAAIPVDSAQ